MEGRRYPRIPFGDSDQLRVGEFVVAVGSPFDFESTVTVGVVSAKGRRGLTSGGIQDYIQTDAAVNPGNSGGPLLNTRGEVVGMNTAIFAPDAEQNTGISFAIPSNMLSRIVKDLRILGRVRRGHMGLSAHTVNEVSGDTSRSGAEVLHVIADSPAEKAGLRRGDIIVTANNEPIPSATALRSLIRARGFGSELTFEVVRDELSEEIVAITGDDRAMLGKHAPDLASGLSWAGMQLSDALPELQSLLGISIERGVIIVSVEPDSPASDLGFTSGDILIQVQGKPIQQILDLKQAIEKNPDKAKVVTIQRGTGTNYAILPPQSWALKP